MDKNKYIELLCAEIDRHWPEMVEMSDGFAAEPEISGSEFKTSKKIVDVLKKAGFDVEYPLWNFQLHSLPKKENPEAVEG